MIEQTYVTQAALHNCLEPHGCTATWEGDHLTIWDSTQSIFDVRQEVAEKLGLPEHHVRVIKQFMGGGFGSKQIAWKHTAIAALLSQQAGRPVQLMLDREAENLASGNRNPTRQRVRLGAKRDGTLVAIECEIDQAVGAYMVGGEARDVGGAVPDALPLPERRAPSRPPSTPTPARPSPSARPATSRGRSRSNRRWTSWRARWTWTRSSCACATTPSATSIAPCRS